MHALHDVGFAHIAVREAGEGPPVLFIHGWPFYGFTWRKIVPALSRSYRCIVADLPGAGSSWWQKENDFTTCGHADNLHRLLDAMKLDRVALVAHDSGATVARRLAVIAPDRIAKMALINTEIPYHRPPYIGLFQRLTALPGSRAAFRQLLSSRRFLRSSMGFGGCFHDLSLIDGEFRDSFVQPLVSEPLRLDGAIRSLQGIDWALVDALSRDHALIQSEVRFIWGAEDPTFPLARARPMVSQLRYGSLVEIRGAKLLPHEERPDDVAREVLAFFGAA